MQIELRSRKFSVGILALSLGAISAFTPATAESPTAPPGTYSTSWMGNTFMKVNGAQEETVPELVNDMAVSPNGTVFTAGYHERAGGAASFTSTGAFAGRYSGFTIDFGDPSSAVAAETPMFTSAPEMA